MASSCGPLSGGGGGPLAVLLLLLLLLLQPGLGEAPGSAKGARGGVAPHSRAPLPSGGGHEHPGDPGASPQNPPPVGVLPSFGVPGSNGTARDPSLLSVTSGNFSKALSTSNIRSPTWHTTESWFTAVPGCGHRTMRIVGGLPAVEKKWPWQVSLQISDKHFCGGSLINHLWVLTAAHCIYGHLEYTVKLGDINVHHGSRTAVIVPVRDIVIHKDYNGVGRLQNDIALVLLDFPVNYSSHIQPVCLPEKAFLVQADTECWVTGWGKRSQSGTSDDVPIILQEAELSIIRYEKCNKMFQKMTASSQEFVREGVVCGYNPRGKDSCQGDSGGPLVCEFNNTWMQVGIVSWGIGCGQKGFPGVYTEISYYKDWLFSQLNQASCLGPAAFLILLLFLELPLGILMTL